MDLAMQQAQQFLSHPLPMDPQLPPADAQQAQPQQATIFAGLQQPAPARPSMADLNKQFQEQQTALTAELNAAPVQAAVVPNLAQQQKAAIGLLEQQTGVTPAAQQNFADLQRQFQHQQQSLAQQMQTGIVTPGAV